MRWTFRLAALFIALWALYVASPFVALSRLAAAVETRDVSAIAERVDFRTLQLSLTRQIVSEYLRSVGRGDELSGFSRNAAASMAATVADPLVAQFVTPDALDHLMRGSLPAQAGGTDAPQALPFGFRSLGNAWRTYIASESRGFTNLLVPVPADRSTAEQYKLHLRLKGLTWRLHGIELPAPVVQALVKKLPRSTAEKAAPLPPA